METAEETWRNILAVDGYKNVLVDCTGKAEQFRESFGFHNFRLYVRLQSGSIVRRAFKRRENQSN